MDGFWRAVRNVLFILSLPLWIVAMAVGVVLFAVVMYARAAVAAVWMPVRQRKTTRESIVGEPHFLKLGESTRSRVSDRPER